jgi:hypothetical protein
MYSAALGHPAVDLAQSVGGRLGQEIALHDRPDALVGITIHCEVPTAECSAACAF